jgi:heptosyltransferase-2
VLLLPNSFRSALAARMSGAPIRIGYNRDGRGWLLSHKLSPPPAKPIPAVEYYATLVEFALGSQDIDRRIELHCSADELAQADRLLEGVRRPFIVLNPGANRADKRWPAERFAAVADQLASSHQVSVVVSGSPKESDVLAAVIAASRTPITDLTARGITLGSLKAVLKQSALLITNDTGPRHIAAALGTPVVTLFGPTDHRWTTLADVNECILLADPFLPEELTADDHARACQIERIPASDVLAAANALLR